MTRPRWVIVYDSPDSRTRRSTSLVFAFNSLIPISVIVPPEQVTTFVTTLYHRPLLPVRQDEQELVHQVCRQERRYLARVVGRANLHDVEAHQRQASQAADQLHDLAAGEPR